MDTDSGMQGKFREEVRERWVSVFHCESSEMRRSGLDWTTDGVRPPEFLLGLRSLVGELTRREEPRTGFDLWEERGYENSLQVKVQIIVSIKTSGHKQPYFGSHVTKKIITEENSLAHSAPSIPKRYLAFTRQVARCSGSTPDRVLVPKGSKLVYKHVIHLLEAPEILCSAFS